MKEAKPDTAPLTEGDAQAKDHAGTWQLRFGLPTGRPGPSGGMAALCRERSLHKGFALRGLAGYTADQPSRGNRKVTTSATP
jgi:hypothetical protein